MDNESVYLIDKDVESLKKRIIELEMKVERHRTTSIELAITAGWNDEEIKNVIGSSDDEINFFRG